MKTYLLIGVAAMPLLAQAAPPISLNDAAKYAAVIENAAVCKADAFRAVERIVSTYGQRQPNGTTRFDGFTAFGYPVAHVYLTQGFFSVAIQDGSIDDLKKAAEPKLKKRQAAIDAAKGDGVKAGYYYPSTYKVRGSDKWFAQPSIQNSNFGGMPEVACLAMAPG